jgi:hypothetical protein
LKIRVVPCHTAAKGGDAVRNPQKLALWLKHGARWVVKRRTATAKHSAASQGRLIDAAPEGVDLQ